MTARSFLAFLLLAAAFALASWLGWWTVPVVAAVWGGLRPGLRRPILSAALAAALGWGAWLLADLLRDPAAFARLGPRLGSVMQIPSPFLLLITLLFPALLAWSAAALTCGLAGLLDPQRGDSR